MGSLLAESYLAPYGRELSGCVLLGVLSPPPPLLLLFGRLVAALGMAFKGPTASARLLHSLSFDSNNRDFLPARTAVDWLTRDTAEVDKYLADPLCGFVASYGLYAEMFASLASVYRRASSFSGLPKPLPVLILAGAEDPLGGALGFVSLLADRFKAAGLQDIETRLYPGARHEILNETNRDEVMADMKLWLEAKLSATAESRLAKTTA
jgi:alpha-beta hydrolase superfamily lysophospholipase